VFLKELKKSQEKQMTIRKSMNVEAHKGSLEGLKQPIMLVPDNEIKGIRGVYKETIQCSIEYNKPVPAQPLTCMQRFLGLFYKGK